MTTVLVIFSLWAQRARMYWVNYYHMKNSMSSNNQHIHGLLLEQSKQNHRLQIPIYQVSRTNLLSLIDTFQ